MPPWEQHADQSDQNYRNWQTQYAQSSNWHQHQQQPQQQQQQPATAPPPTQLFHQVTSKGAWISSRSAVVGLHHIGGSVPCGFDALWIQRNGGSHPAALVSAFLALAAAIYILLLQQNLFLTRACA